jgi:hypothetical protein
MRDFPKTWMATITAIKYIKYQLEDGDELRPVTAMFFKADFQDMYHVIIEDKEMEMPDYYFMDQNQIREAFGDLDFLTKLIG